MKNCKNFKIYKFGYNYPKGRGTKSHRIRWERAEDLSQFKIKLFNKYCSLNFQELCNKSMSGVRYKGYLTSPFDRGSDMLQDEHGLHFGNYWDQLYIAVPITKTDIIDFFDNNIPSWVTTVKKI